MAETGSPQFIVSRSVTCLFSGLISVSAALTLLLAAIGRLMNEDSDYLWSTKWILLIQSIGVVVGTIAPMFGWFFAVGLRSRKGEVINSYRDEFKVEFYWIQTLVQLRDGPLPIRFKNLTCTKLIQDFRHTIFNLCICVQTGLVVTSKLVQLISIFVVKAILWCCHRNNKLGRKLANKPYPSNNRRGVEKGDDTEQDLEHFVLLLAGEDELPRAILKDICQAVRRFIKKGQDQQPQLLIGLLNKFINFNGVLRFENDPAPASNYKELPSCWSLPVVTLTSIAIALPNVTKDKVESLLRSVSEGLFYAKMVEEDLDRKEESKSISNASYFVWRGVEFYKKWMDEDLGRLSFSGKTAKEILQDLANLAKKEVDQVDTNNNGRMASAYRQHCDLHLPINVIAANSMYRMSNTIVSSYKDDSTWTDEGLFEEISGVIASIFTACFTNLPSVITMKCFSSSLEKKEENVRQAAYLLGEVEEILKIIQGHEVPPSLDPQSMAYIDEWRKAMKMTNTSVSIFPRNHDKIVSNGVGGDELSIQVE